MITPVILYMTSAKAAKSQDNLCLLADQGDAKPKNRATTMICSMLPSIGLEKDCGNKAEMTFATEGAVAAVTWAPPHQW